MFRVNRRKHIASLIATKQLAFYTGQRPGWATTPIMYTLEKFPAAGGSNTPPSALLSSPGSHGNTNPSGIYFAISTFWRRKRADSVSRRVDLTFFFVPNKKQTIFMDALRTASKLSNHYFWWIDWIQFPSMWWMQILLFFPRRLSHCLLSNS